MRRLSPSIKRLLIVAAALLLLGAALGRVLPESRPEAPAEDQWDPTGSHPLPNQSVERGP